ncbi:prepilin-type N-terminal cleavage/methylation domain-containing protein [Methylomonas sp. LL1]|uniref:prepilin-type N-terminal cleavage/methylation domain-containing protein n=1 Tax=Methylomonas sp. LL1 TaxID=2785785 RepID=UPI0018C430D7|nr:prepilin-type N-terminal cleavage/methylation domain-containing protein [Methylomonas sp. LL1]QPK64645.1 prepilin-type N-terminal cleavage/methylation domain-containing protein [Methylomonas sp. LL1]
MRIARRNGFTLIEVLIAMTLLGVMVVLLFSSLKVAAESWNAGENKIAEVNKKAVVYQFFKRHLTAIRPLPSLDTEQNFETGSQQVFQGFNQSLRFAGALPASSARKGIQVFELELDPAKSSSLRVRLSPYRLSDDDPKAEEPVVLLENIAQLKFSYFGKTEDIAEQQWRDEWTIADRLPGLIKVSISLEDGSYWPEMVFPVKITQAHTAESVTEQADVAENP